MEITILVDYHEKVKDEYFIVSDFQNLRDARALCKFLELPDVEDLLLPTGVEIRGLKSKKKIADDKYYYLQLDIEGTVIMRNYENPSISYTIDYSQVASDKHKELVERNYTPELAQITNTTNIDDFAQHINQTKIADLSSFYVRVNDVMQGNWNELHIGDDIPIVYDIGTNKDDSFVDIQVTANKYSSSYVSSSVKPALIISHWDKDHYNCLQQMSATALKCFSYFLCINPLPNATSEKAYQKISSVAGIRILSFDAMTRTRAMGPAVINTIIKTDRFSLFQGIGTGRNQTGLILSLKNSVDSSTLLTGDAAWFQIAHIVNEESQNFPWIRYFNLVVPHHGSGRDTSYRAFVIPPPCDGKESAISVSERHNSWGHPSSGVENYLTSIFKKVGRTDKVGSIDLR